MIKNLFRCLYLIVILCSFSIPVQAEIESSLKSPSYSADKWAYYYDVYGFKENGLWGLADDNGVRCSARYREIEALNSDFIKARVGYSSSYGVVQQCQRLFE